MAEKKKSTTKKNVSAGREGVDYLKRVLDPIATLIALGL